MAVQFLLFPLMWNLSLGYSLAQPLISYENRRGLLYNRYVALNFGGNAGLGRMVSIIHAQAVMEREVEATLVDDGFHPLSILHRYRDINSAPSHSPQGGASDGAYLSVVR